MTKDKKTHIHSFSADGNRVFTFMARAPKHPSEAREENSAAVFLIAMPEASTLDDFHKYYCTLLDRKIQNYLIRFGDPQDRVHKSAAKENAKEAEESAQTDEIRYYGPKERAENEENILDASSIQLRVLGLNQGDVFGHRLEVTGATWVPVICGGFQTVEDISDYPSSQRVLVRVKEGSAVDGNQIFKDLPLTRPENSSISEAEEERLVLKMLDRMRNFFDKTLPAMTFAMSCISILDYVRLHRLINFEDAQNRNEWCASIIYAASEINAHDPIYLQMHFDPESITSHFKVPKEVLIARTAEVYKVLEEENLSIDDVSIHGLLKNDCLKEHFDQLNDVLGNKTAKIHKMHDDKRDRKKKRRVQKRR